MMRKFVGVAAMAGALAFAGCSEPVSRVKGTVTLDGKPVKAGTVVFFPPNNQTYMADIQPDGTYTCPAVPRGRVRVAVQLPLPTVAPRPETPGRDAAANPEMAADDAGKRARLPAPPEPTAKAAAPRFADPGTSGLAFDLTAAEQEFPIELK